MSLPDVGFRPDTPTALTIIDCAVWPYTVQAGTTQAKFKVDAHSAFSKELQPMSIAQGDTIQVTASKRTDGSVAFAVEMIARHRPEPNTEEHAQWKYDGIVLMMRRCIASAINKLQSEQPGAYIGTGRPDGYVHVHPELQII
jgi:hypothetical protein